MILAANFFDSSASGETDRDMLRRNSEVVRVSEQALVSPTSRSLTLPHISQIFHFKAQFEQEHQCRCSRGGHNV